MADTASSPMAWPWPRLLPLFGALSVAAVLCACVCLQAAVYVQPNMCAMSYMHPAFVPVALTNTGDDGDVVAGDEHIDVESPTASLVHRVSNMLLGVGHLDYIAQHDGETRYRLLLYQDGRFKRHRKQHGRQAGAEVDAPGPAVLFVPGNAGSYAQSRSLGGRLAELGSSAQVYAADFNEEMSALSSALILRQAAFVARCVRHLSSASRAPLTLVGHSTGGLVARTLLLNNPTLANNYIRVIITLATPHAFPVFPFDAGFRRVYRLQDGGLDDNNGGSVYVMSIGGGERDSLVTGAHTSTNNTPLLARYGAAIKTDSVHGVWASTDHLCILWCRELVHAVAHGVAITSARKNASAEQTRTDFQAVLQITSDAMTNAATASWLPACNTMTTVPATDETVRLDWQPQPRLHCTTLLAPPAGGALVVLSALVPGSRLFVATNDTNDSKLTDASAVDVTALLRPMPLPTRGQQFHYTMKIYVAQQHAVIIALNTSRFDKEASVMTSWVPEPTPTNRGLSATSPALVLNLNHTHLEHLVDVNTPSLPWWTFVHVGLSAVCSKERDVLQVSWQRQAATGSPEYGWARRTPAQTPRAQVQLTVEAPAETGRLVAWTGPTCQDAVLTVRVALAASLDQFLRAYASHVVTVACGLGVLELVSHGWGKGSAGWVSALAPRVMVLAAAAVGLVWRHDVGNNNPDSLTACLVAASAGAVHVVVTVALCAWLKLCSLVKLPSLPTTIAAADTLVIATAGTAALLALQAATCAGVVMVGPLLLLLTWRCLDQRQVQWAAQGAPNTLGKNPQSNRKPDETSALFANLAVFRLLILSLPCAAGPTIMLFRDGAVARGSDASCALVPLVVLGWLCATDSNSLRAQDNTRVWVTTATQIALGLATGAVADPFSAGFVGHGSAVAVLAATAAAVARSS
eukprot:m.140037 g.140037  ORF g.140037 m.140037 type:complete len:919 (-) comp17074_c0_seq1:167-2923(-)